MEPDPQQPGLLRLGGVQFWVVATMLCVVVLVATATLWPQLAEEYILVVRAPSLERTFGFHGEYIARAYVVTEVANGGRLHQAGFRTGDRPSAGICRFYGDYVSAEAFLDDLDHVQAGHAVEFTVARGRGETLEFVKLKLPGSPRESRR
jgi:hypothetical protein